MLNYKIYGIVLFFSISLSATGLYAEGRWVSFKKDIVGTVWQIYFKYPKEYNIKENIEYFKAGYPTHYYLFSKEDDCFLNFSSAKCDNVYFSFSISANEQALPLTFNSKIENKINFNGTKGNIAIKGKRNIRFLSPDGGAEISFTGVGPVFDEVLKTIRFDK